MAESPKLHVQRYLKKKSLDDLAAEYGIKVYRHPTTNLVGLKYSQIESPKMSPIVRECRGIVLRDGSWELVAKGFDRFLNMGESREDDNAFDFHNFRADAKEDGSLMLVYWADGEWRVNTSGSFGLGDLGDTGRSWCDHFWDAFGDPARLDGHQGRTLVFEFCAPPNKVVRLYPRPRLFLLSVFTGHLEEPPHWVDETAVDIRIDRPSESHVFIGQHGRAPLEAIVKAKEDTDPTFEGYVLRDSAGRRLKVKTTTYLSLHRLKGNGNIFHPKRLIPIALSNERDEVLTYFPEIKDALDEVHEALAKASAELSGIWADAQGAESQKDFAMAVKHHPLAGLLFGARKAGNGLDAMAELRSMDPEKLARLLFGDKVFGSAAEVTP